MSIFRNMKESLSGHIRRIREKRPEGPAHRLSKGRMILSGLLMATAAVLIAGLVVASAIVPFILALFWYIEQKGVDAVVEAGFSYVKNRKQAAGTAEVHAGKNMARRMEGSG